MLSAHPDIEIKYLPPSVREFNPQERVRPSFVMKSPLPESPANIVFIAKLRQVWYGVLDDPTLARECGINLARAPGRYYNEHARAGLCHNDFQGLA